MTLTNRIRISFILFLSSEVNKRELLSEVLGWNFVFNALDYFFESVYLLANNDNFRENLNPTSHCM